MNARMLSRFGATLMSALIIGLAANAEPVRLVVDNALIFTMAEGQEAGIAGHLVIDTEGRVRAVGAGPADAVWEPETHLDLAGQWILPGFVSAHSHLWQSAWRGLAANQTLMGWVDALYLERAQYAEPEDYYWFTLYGALDHVRHGITSTYNFNYGGWSEPAYAEAQLRGEVESGVRFVHGQNFGGWGGVPSEAEGLAAAKAFLDWIGVQATRDQLLGVMINGTAAFRDTAQAAITEAAIGRAFPEIGNHIHLLESAPEQFEERSRFRWMVDAGLITDRVLLGHFIHSDPWILEQVTAAGAAMSWNPLSNGRLASGIADIPLYLAKGLRVGMGVDGQASADRADPFENVRAGLYAVRGKYGDASVLSPYQVLRLHTMGSADALGAGDLVGSLELGKFGDFVVIDPTDFGVVFDAYASLAFMAGQEHLRAVYIGGVLQARDGDPVNADLAAIRREVNHRLEQAHP